MAQTSVQFTPVQVLQAARRAEAEGKMDYALQFYRHLVEQHGSSPEAQEAREGLFRIAEWRWGEARVARNREAGNPAGAPASQQQQPPPSQSSAASQRVYNVASNPQQQVHAYAEHDAGTSGLPQIISRQHAQAAGKEVPVFHARFRAAKFFAHALSAVGWLTLLSGIAAGVAGAAGLVGELSTVMLLGTPFGVMIGAPAVLLGLLLIVGGQLAAALFESVNATLEMVSIERGRTSF